MGRGRTSVLPETEQTAKFGPMNAPNLRSKVVDEARDRPGVYEWRDRTGRILYVGKSVRLRTRLLSYFREERAKVVRLVAQAADLRWDYLPNEFAALRREMFLIRAWQPEYNVQHKRDRRHGFIKVTCEAAPRLAAVTRVAGDGARYYGPFAQTRWMRRAVHELALATGVRDCPAHTPVHFADQIDLFALARTPGCIRAETRTCPAPCAGHCTAAEYADRLGVARAFLEARSRDPLRELARAVRDASGRLDYEYAGRLQDRHRVLERLWNHLSGFRGQIRNFNLVYTAPGFEGDDRLYVIRRGRVAAEMKAPKTPGDLRRARRAVRDAFRAIPSDRDASLSGDAAAEVLLTVTWFNQHAEERQRAMSPEGWLAGEGG